MKVDTFDGSLRCDPGEPIYPSTCERHSDHYWCPACHGYYGVPHDAPGECHSRLVTVSARRFWSSWRGADGCVCRFCTVAAVVGVDEAIDQWKRRDLRPEPLRPPSPVGAASMAPPKRLFRRKARS